MRIVCNQVLFSISPAKKGAEGPRLYQELLDYSPVSAIGNTADAASSN